MSSPPETPATAGGRDAADRLAARIVDALLDRPLAALLPPEPVASLVCQAALRYLRSGADDKLVRLLITRVSDFLKRHDGHTVRELVGRDVAALLVELAGRPYAPDRQLLIRLFSREPFRRLNRELMTGTLADYSKRLRSTVAETGAGKGLGALGRLARSSTIGSIAGGVASVVSDEFERQMGRRTAEFADSAVDDLVGRLATLLTDPARRSEHTAQRLELLDFVLDLRGRELVQELERLQPQAVSVEVQQAVLRWLGRSSAAADLAGALKRLAEATGGKPIGQLAPVAAVRPFLVAALAGLLRPLAASGELLHLLTDPAKS